MKRIKQALETMKQDVSFFPSAEYNQPLIIIKGNGQFTIESTYTLNAFSDSNINLSAAGKIISITGKNIKLKAMYREELMVEGTFTSIEFLDEKEEP